jgi:hypothetical protein
MANILISGDSWGIGVFTGADDTYGPTGQGIHTILESLGHTIINISKGGGSNWLMIDRLEHRWGNTGKCSFGIDPLDKIDFDLTTVDYILFLQTDIFRERHYYGKQYESDTKGSWKILEQAFVDSLLNFNTLDQFTINYFDEFYSKLNSIGQQHNKKILMIGGWSQLHPSIVNYPNLIPVVHSATKLLIPELEEDLYLSDPEWYSQLADDSEFMQQFGNEFKKMTLVNANKLNLIYNKWNEVHPNIQGYQTIVDNILPYLAKIS